MFAIDYPFKTIRLHGKERETNGGYGFACVLCTPFIYFLKLISDFAECLPFLLVISMNQIGALTGQ
jgi:hypothetical protein